MARIESWAYSDGTAKFRAVNSLVVCEQPTSPATTTARLPEPMLFSAALDEWRAQLDAHTPAGLYAITYDSATRRVKIRTTNGVSFKPVWTADADLARWLGFDPTATYAFATSHTGTAAPWGRCDLLGVDVEAPEDAAQVELQQLRLGRAVAPVFGNHQLTTVGLVVQRDAAPSNWAWLTTGRVRIYPSSSVTAYGPLDLDGYLDGYVVEQPSLDQLGTDEGLSVLQLLLALPRG